MRSILVCILLAASANAQQAASADPAPSQPKASDTTGTTSYPFARRSEVSDTFHGVVVPDPYRWMEDLRSAELATWIEAQNRISAARLTTDPAHAAIRRRLEALANVYPTRQPELEAGTYHFFLTYEDDRPRLFVRESETATPRLLLDPGARVEGLVLKHYVPSPDGRHVAYVVAQGGVDWGEIRIHDVRANRDLADVLPHVRFGGPMAWTADAKGLVYRRVAPPRDGKLEAPAEDPGLFLHRLSEPPRVDIRLYSVPADRRDWSLSFDLPGDRRQLFAYVERGPWGDGNRGGARAQVVHLELDRRGRARDRVSPRTLTQDGAAHRVLHTEAGRAWLFTDHDAPRGRVVSFDLARPAPSAWRTVVPEGDGVLTHAQWFGGRLVVHSIENVRSVVRIFDPEGKRSHDLSLPGTGVVQAVFGSPTSSRVGLLYSGLLQAPVLLEHDLETDKTRTVATGSGAPDLGAFEVRQEWFASRDGTRVPMFVAARRGLARDGSHPTILHAYGASGTSLLPAFSEDIATWLQMGGVYVLANLRGGGEFGRAWYEAAIRERKQTTFDDMIAAARHLIDQGWTSPRRLAISGASNGGLLVTATMLQRPELFRAVLADVPVTDAMRRHLSGNGRQQVEQWGTPDDAAVFPALRKYSPLHNVKAGTCYPATLVSTSRDDDRLPPWHGYKLTAALQAAQGCTAPILLHVRDSGGHGAASVGDWYDFVALQFTFAAQQLELRTPP